MRLLPHGWVPQCCKWVLGFSSTPFWLYWPTSLLFALFNGPPSLVSLFLFPFQTTSVTISKIRLQLWAESLIFCYFPPLFFWIWLLIRWVVFPWTLSFVLQNCPSLVKNPSLGSSTNKARRRWRKMLLARLFMALGLYWVITAETLCFLTTSWQTGHISTGWRPLWERIFDAFSRSFKIANYPLFLYLTHIRTVFLYKSQLTFPFSLCYTSTIQVFTLFLLAKRLVGAVAARSSDSISKYDIYYS